MPPRTKRHAMASSNDYRKPRNKELKDLTWNLPYALRIKDPDGRILWQNRTAEELDEGSDWNEHPVSWQNQKAVLELPVDRSSVEARSRIAELEEEVSRLKKHQRGTARKKKRAEEKARKKQKSAGAAEKREEKLQEQLEKLQRENDQLKAELESAPAGAESDKETKRLNKQVKELESKLATKDKSLERVSSELEAQAKKLEQLQGESEERSKEMESLLKEKERLEKALADAPEAIETPAVDPALEEKAEKLAEDKKALENWVEDLEEKLDAEKTKAAGLEAELAKAEKRCHELEAESSDRVADEIADQLEALKQEKSEFQDQLKAQEEELEKLRVLASQKSSESRNDGGASAKLQEELEEAKAALASANRREERLSEKLKTLEELRQEHGNVLSMLREDLKDSRDREKELKETIKLYSDVRQRLEEAREKISTLEASEEKLKEQLKAGGASRTAGEAPADEDTLSISVKTQIKFLEKRVADTEKKLDAANAQLQKEQAQNKSAKETERLAYQDTLTTLPNRNMIDRYLSYAHQQSRSSGRSLGLFVIDIDGFRYLNNTFGREWADELLKAVGQRLNSMRGGSHLVARKGQDQFILLAADIEKKAAPTFCQEAARSLLEALAYPFDVSGQEVKLTGSIGASLGPLEGDSSLGLYEHSMMALEQAKRRGTSQFVLFDESVRQKEQQESVYAKQMEHAIEKDEFKAVFQPVFHLGKGLVMGLELLMRWEHRDQRELKPGDFLDAAIKSGLIFKMTERVWPKAFQNFAKWQRMRPGLTLSINLCDKELLSPSLLKKAVQWVQQYGVAPSSVIFEVRDQSRLRRSPNWWQILQDYHAAGFGLCLDDFGSDASYFGTLAYQGFKQAKMRVSDEKSLQLVAAPQAGKHVQYCAKFLQSKFDKKALMKAGFHLAQGYAVSRPLDYDGVDMVLS